MIPRHVRALLGDVVTLEGRQRQKGHLFDTDLLREFTVVLDDGAKGFLRVIDKVHLVDGHGNVTDAHQRHQIAVTARLREDALACIDHQNRRIGGRSTSDHIARVLLMAGRIGDDELTLVGREETIRDVDGDALLAFGGEAIDEQCEVEIIALRAHLLRVRLKRGKLVIEKHLRLIQQAADQRALAVINTAAGDEAQQLFGLVRLQVLLDVLGNQLGNVCHQK